MRLYQARFATTSPHESGDNSIKGRWFSSRREALRFLKTIDGERRYGISEAHFGTTRAELVTLLDGLTAT